ncbi:amino acid adenylation domain-containing protein [Glutamicibacter ardleyensis]|uniref:amino acid adenylation domain-containing protein n=1 Tax=Glutamicibacter ardleyensis TaxID=225894 RepID=UPI003FD5B340
MKSIRTTNDLLRSNGRRMTASSIETQLMALPAVDNCAVVSCKDSAGLSVIVAFAQIKPGHDIGDVDPSTLGVNEVVELSTIPCRPDGGVDYAFLRGFQPISRTALHLEEERWRKTEALASSALVYAERYDFGSSIKPAGNLQANLGSPEGTSDADTARTLSVSDTLAHVIGDPLASVPGDVATLTEMLLRAATEEPDKGIVFLDGNGTQRFVGYALLLEKAERIAAALASENVASGDFVIVLTTSNEDFAYAFWGCVLAGAVVVPITAPAAGSDVLAYAGVEQIWESADKPLVLRSGTASDLWSSQRHDIRTLEVDLALESEPAPTYRSVAPESPAVIMFTSGSTGKPKGVIQTHQNIVHKQRAAVQHSQYNSDDVMLNWLSIEHVVGLIHFHLLPVYLRATQVHAATEYILKQPTRWLDMISDHHATITWAPNSLFALLADGIDGARQAWNLTSVRRLINAGEQVSYATCARLASKLAAHGLQSGAIKPEWGMSETCNMVVVSDSLQSGSLSGVHVVKSVSATGTVQFETQLDGSKAVLVECGRIYPGLEMRVVGENSRVLNENQIGRFQVRGTTLLPEYYANPEANQKAFTSDGWFDTGDLAFLHNGSATFTGRVSETIVINGINYQNVDIETAVETVDGIDVSFTAACAIRERGDETDSIAVFFVPVDRAKEAVLSQVRQIHSQLAATIGVRARHIVPVTRDDIPKTSIGKIQRSKIIARWEAGDFDEAIRVYGENDAEPERGILPWFFAESFTPIDIGFIADKATFHYIDEPASQLPSALKDAFSGWSDTELQGTVPGGTASEDIIVDTTLVGNRGQEHLVRQVFENIARSGASGGFKKYLIVTDVNAPAESPVQPYLSLIEGFVQSLNQELDRSKVVWIQTDCTQEANLRGVFLEALSKEHRSVVRIVSGIRYVKGLAAASEGISPEAESSIVPGGRYLVTGGFGGVGQLLCSWLVQEYGVELVVLGRTAEERLSPQKKAFLSELNVRGTCTYIACDVGETDVSSVLQAALDANSIAHMDGLFHLAGVGSFAPSVDGDSSALQYADQAVIRESLAPKIFGLESLASFFEKDASIIAFGSINGYFGGAGYGVYSAVNSALHHSIERLRADGYSAARYLSWSAWTGVGMSHGGASEVLLQSKGFAALTPTQALDSLDLALRTDRSALHIGLDGNHPNIKAEILEKRRLRVSPVYLYEAGGEIPSREAIELFGSDVLEKFDSMPLTSSGDIDVRAAIIGGSGRNRLVPLATPTEERLAAVWSEVLNVSTVGRESDFFRLGGHSLNAAKLATLVRREFEVNLPLHEILTSSALADMAELIEALLGEHNAPLEVARPMELPSGSLSHAQRRVIFHEQVEEESGAYNIAGAWSLRGSVDVDLLNKAIDHITQRHEMLRTVFRFEHGVPVQELRDRMPNAVSRYDLRTMPEAVRTSEADILVSREASAPYQLDAGPLTRYSIIRLSEQEFILLVGHHHIISDGWSLGVFMEELTTIYNALHDRSIPSLPPAPSGIAELMAQSSADAATAEADRTYWQQEMDHAPDVLALPLDFERPAVQSYRGDTHSVEIDSALLENIDAAARSLGVSRFVYLLAAYGIFLRKLTGQEDLIIGVPSAGREDPRVSQVIGMFVNTLPVRIGVDLSSTVSECVTQVKTKVAAMVRHHSYPFDELLNSLGLVREAAHTPVFQTVFNYVSASTPPQFAGIETAMWPVRHQQSKFDMSVNMYESGTGLVIAFEYAQSLLRDETVRRWSEHFTVLLAAMSHNVRGTVQDVEILSAEQRGNIRDLGTSPADPDKRLTIQSAFAHTVKAHGGRPSVTMHGRSLSYLELDRHASDLAAQMEDGGVRQGERVAVLAERSIETIIGILAIIKLGATYIPVDSRLPEKAVLAILDDSSATTIISSTGMRRKEAALWTRIATDTPLDFSSSNRNASPRNFSPNDDAYIIYTSGTTGKPKGVLLSQRNILSLVIDPDWIELSSADSILQTGSLSFDASTFEIWGALLNGGRLCLIEEATLLDPKALSEAIAHYEPSITWFTAPLFNQLVDADVELFRGCATIIVGGDALSVKHVTAVRAAHPHLVLINGYGPTENTTFSTTFCIDREYVSAIPIGTPMRNAVAYVLDDRMRVVPFGVAGELFVGGDGLAVGYVNDEELTREKFVESSNFPGVRLYRTGDIAKLMPDGNIHYLGRSDNQVKVRGHRVELDAIRRTLCDVPGVVDAHIVVTGTSPASLLAYIVAPKSTPRAVRAALTKMLPDYAIPGRIAMVGGFPLKSSGKVDSLRLAELQLDERPEAEPEAEDLSQLEHELLAAYREVTGTPGAGPDDSFFEIGGDSLLTIRLTSAMRARGIELDPKQVFLAPDVRSLAAELNTSAGKYRESGTDAARNCVRLNPTANEGPGIVFAPPAGGTVLGYIELSRHLQRFGPSFGIQAPGLAADELPEYLSFEEMVDFCLDSAADHVSQNTYIGGHSLGGHIAFNMCARLLDRGVRPKGLIILDTPPDLGAIPITSTDMTDEEFKLFVLSMGIGNMIHSDPDELRQLSLEDAKSRVLEAARSDATIAAFMDEDLLDRYLRLQLHQMTYSRDVVLTPIKLDIPIYVFRSTEHPEEVRTLFDDWKRFSGGEITFIDVPGNHTSMMRQPHVVELADLLERNCLLEQTIRSKGARNGD